MSIKVRFIGICTHVRNLGEGENGSSSRRVVLVRADHGAFINDAAIPPHIAKLKIDPAHIVNIDSFPHGLGTTGQAGVWQLNGVHLALEGSTESYRPDPSCDSIPPLETKASPVLSTEVMAHGQAACYFDIAEGRMTSETTPEGAIIAILETETTDTPALRVTAFWNQVPYRIWLRPGATIEVMHMGYQQGDTDQDFLLHYRIFIEVPRDAKVPPKPKRDGNSGDLSIGCSNSQYP